MLLSFVVCCASWLSLIAFSELMLVDCLWVTNWLLPAVLSFGFSWVVVAVM